MRNLIDLHCDTISELQKKPAGETLEKNSLCVNLEGMRSAGTIVQAFASFVNVKKYIEGGNKDIISKKAWDCAYQEVCVLLERLRQEESPAIQIARSFEEIQKNRQKNRISALATVEEGGVLNERIERLTELYKMGVRLITLTWNYENCIGYPNSRVKKCMGQGLKDFGYEVIEEMNRIGMLIDVSHLSDGGFWDCIRFSKAPVIASHSNVRTLCLHPRNLTDEMLKAIAEKGGVVGLNFYPAFLKEHRQAQMKDIACHGAYMLRVAGEDVAAIGTDFDGFEAENQGNYPAGTADMDKVWDCMKKQGITERQLDKIWSENALRVFREIL